MASVIVGTRLDLCQIGVAVYARNVNGAVERLDTMPGKAGVEGLVFDRFDQIGDLRRGIAVIDFFW